MLEIKNIKKTFNSKLILNDVSFTLEKGKIYGLFGNNGQGKTTLAKIVFNEFDKTGGEINFDKIEQKNIDFTKWYFFTENNELPKNIKAQTYIQGILRLAKISKLEISKRTKEMEILFTNFNFKELKNQKISSLSAGQQKLLTLYACFLLKPKVIFFDEPTANLDIQNKKIVLDAIKQMKNPQTLIVVITHLIEEVQNLVDEIIILDQGKITYRQKNDGSDIKKIFETNVQPTQEKIEIREYFDETTK